MWTQENRRLYDPPVERYPSDLTDEQWSLVGPMIPPAKRGGRRRSVDLRQVLNAIFYVASTGCQWRALPKDLPPKSTAWEYLDLWSWDGTLVKIQDALRERARGRAGRQPDPTVAIVDSQSVKGAEKGGPGSIHRAMTRARKSTARSAISPSIRSASC